MSCVQCHDHKYDPIPTADYYSLHGVFLSSHEPKEMPLLGAASLPPRHDEFLKARVKIEAQIQKLRRDTRAKGLKFRGYSLVGEQRRPIFGYKIGDSLQVADYAEPNAGALPSITRRLRIRGNGEVWYLAAAGDSITEQNGGYNIGGTMLRVSFPELEAKPVVRENSGRKELLIKFNVDGQATLKQQYEWNL